ncbi:MAG: hypothetical protein K6T66_01030 [Peptococcaceae bacterium]|nr:hypothetical protein [Peptococcaceae bacterium]
MEKLSKAEIERQIKMYEGFIKEDEASIKNLREKVSSLQAEYNRRYGSFFGDFSKSKSDLPDEAFKA